MSLIIGCAITPMPQMPRYKTSKGRKCAVECQRIYSDCIKKGTPQGDLFGAPRTPIDRQEECRQMLNECYQLCLDEDET